MFAVLSPLPVLADNHVYYTAFGLNTSICLQGIAASGICRCSKAFNSVANTVTTAKYSSEEAPLRLNEGRLERILLFFNPFSAACPGRTDDSIASYRCILLESTTEV